MPYVKETTTTAKSEYSYFWITCQLNSFPRILDVKPELAHGQHPYGWTALHVAVMNRKPTIVDLILSRSIAALNECDSWDSSDKYRASFASNGFAHRAVHGSTALHYACLLGDMETVKVLLRHGAQWTIPDNIGLLPEHYINVSHGVDKKHEFKCLCEEDELRRAKELEEQLKKLAEEEALKQSKKREKEDELRRAKELEEQSKKLAEEEALKQSKKREKEDELRRAKELEEQSKKLAEEEALKQSKKREQEDQLRRTKELEEKESKRRMRQSKCPTTHHRHRRQLCLHFIFYSRRRD